MPEQTTIEATPPQIGPDHQIAPPSPKPARSTGVRILVWLVILAAFGLLFWIVMHHKQTEATAPRGRRAMMAGPVTVMTAKAIKGSIGVYLDAIGTVTPLNTNAITSQVTGLITGVFYREGQLVQRGQKLIQIDPRQYSANVLAAQGALDRDQNQLALAKMDLARYQAAWARNAIAKQQMEDQERLVMQYEGTVKADQGTLQYNQVLLGYTNITAPISGRVGLRLIDPGNVVQGGSTTPLVVITQIQPITVVFTIPEDNVAEVEDRIRHGNILEVDAYDRTQKTKLAAGKLLTVDNQIDTTTGTLKLRAIFNNKDNALFPNLFVNTRLLVRTLEGVTLIPTSAIQHNADISYVYVIDEDNVAHMRNIKPGVTEGDNTEVQGIAPGDVVANSGFERLQDGAQVIASKRPLPAAAPESNAP